MTGITTGRASADVSLQSALLLYGAKPDEPVFATAHPIALVKGRPTIGAGRPLQRDALISALTKLAKHAAPKAEFLPPTVLGMSPAAVTWWCPPALRRVFFKCTTLGERSAIVPHPGLVFQASNVGFRVFAVVDADRPTAETRLFEPPYFNTWDNGGICIGTARVPKRVDVASIPRWEAGFFESAFTHPNAGGKRVSYTNGEYAFWRDMLDGQFGEAFPLECLVPTRFALLTLVNGRVGGVA
ncbi:PRTRC system protein B [Paraburkholderia sp. BCC1876]|uniref:PRTRC system protein B n=1 Tax=Paraburkholderia sp. BCC1876 TaxID=2676303 RepID=UPI0015913822|nr:PRTRC system protein B [Paraburkholderia sp. BCC1876]